MLWGSPKVEPYPGSLHPLASFRSLALLDLTIGHVHWEPEVIPVLGVFLDVRLCKYRVWGSLVGVVKAGSVVNGLVGHPCGVWPEIRSDGIGPSLIGMYHGGSCHLLEMSDAHFGLSVMVVIVDAREGKALHFCVAIAHPVVCGKGAIVSMIIPYPYPYLP